MFGPRLFALLAALALAMRVLVPAGWMPNGDMGLAICTGEGMATVPVAWAEDWARRIGKPAPTRPDKAEHPCAFAAAAAAIAEPVAPDAPVLAPGQAAPAPSPARALIPGRGLAAPPPPPTGPPARL